MKYKNVQETFLNQLRKSKAPVTLFLTSGFRVRGKIKGFDSYTIFIQSEKGQQQAIYKAVISTIQPEQ